MTTETPSVDRATRLTDDHLRQFTGSEHWYRHGLARDTLFTDGAKYVADQSLPRTRSGGGAYWLLDEIAFAQRGQNRVATEEFQVCKRVAHDDHPKRLFHHHARRQLRQLRRLADALSLPPGAFDGQHLYRSLRGGHRSALFSIAEHGVQASG